MSWKSILNYIARLCLKTINKLHKLTIKEITIKAKVISTPNLPLSGVLLHFIISSALGVICIYNK